MSVVEATQSQTKPQRGRSPGPELKRQAFSTSRLLDFLSEKELTAQIGHAKSAWPLVLVKELLDNAIDACEEAGIAPEVQVTIDDRGLTVSDNGPGIPVDVVTGVLDFAVRVSSREAYVSPCRGAQGNALKTVVAMPFVLNGESGKVTISTRGIRHDMTLRVDRIRQQPVIDHIQHSDAFVQNGTSITVHSASSIAPRNTQFVQDGGEEIVQNEPGCGSESASSLMGDPSRIVQIVDDFTFLNPHLAVTVDWFGERLLEASATHPAWNKWKPSDPTSPHWYQPESFARLISAYLAHDQGAGTQRTVRELVSEFRGLATSAKQKAVLDATGLHRAQLTALVRGDESSLDEFVLGKLLGAMQYVSKPVQPALLGVIGRDHLAAKFAALGCEMESFNYQKGVGETDGLPWIIETAFGWCPNRKNRRIVTGVNWSPGIVNPFRELGKWGQSLDTVLAAQRATADEPVVLILHLACPRVLFADRGKSTIVIGG